MFPERFPNPRPVTLDALRADLRAWCENRPVRLFVIFGSHATGKARLNSDVDIAIWPLEAPSPQTYLAWINELLDLTGREISLVIVDADTNPVLGWEIARNGVPAYELEEGLWNHLYLQRWHVYNDALPFRRAEAKELRDFAESRRREQEDGS